MKGKVAIVTGAGTGIGLAIAERLAKGGAHVILIGRSKNVLQEAERLHGMGHAAEGAILDVADATAIEKFVKDVNARHGSIDILVNNAGVHPKRNGRASLVEETSNEEWETVMRINLTGPMVFCREVLPIMKAKGWGRIINISSRAARTNIPQSGIHLAASKAGMIGMTRVIADQGGPQGVTANCIAPGRIETPLSNKSSEEVLREAKKRIPVGRFGTPAEMAAIVEFLASDEAGFITGAVIDANGGAFMG